MHMYTCTRAPWKYEPWNQKRWQVQHYASKQPGLLATDRQIDTHTHAHAHPHTHTHIHTHTVTLPARSSSAWAALLQQVSVLACSTVISFSSAVQSVTLPVRVLICWCRSGSHRIHVTEIGRISASVQLLNMLSVCMHCKSGASESDLVWYGQPSEVQFTHGGRGGWAENFGNLEPRSVHSIESRGAWGK